MTKHIGGTQIHLKPLVLTNEAFPAGLGKIPVNGLVPG